MADVLRRRQVEALAAELADPTALLVRWFEQNNADWAKPPSDETVNTLAARFAQYRPTDERTVEHEALEVLRAFLSTFPDASQKQMLLATLASGMHHAQRPRHAAKAQALLDGHTVPSQAADG
ncbi:hypothetical protein [Kitasatospora griseola]|uniref:hypothetical protein n=1 Tax=Kitasatospora griseola TaxID=2064 RepID=UPI003827AD27